MPLTVVEDPPDRPDFIQETVRLLTDRLGTERGGLLQRVERASDTALASGTDQEWGIGQVAAHLLIVERGVLGLALRLAKGEEPGPTGQPRPAAAEMSRGGILALAERTRRAAEALRTDFPAQPDDRATARHPFYDPRGPERISRSGTRGVAGASAPANAEVRRAELLRLASDIAEPLLRPPERPRPGRADPPVTSGTRSA